MIQLTDHDLELARNRFEDSFVERKTANDSKDWPKTAVAFANSAPIGFPAIMFIGVRDDGTVEGGTNLDSLQRTLSEKLANAYPSIPYLARCLETDGKQFLAVIIQGSERRPHFGGHAYIRDGSKTLSSSAEQFERLVVQRNSKAYRISEWKGKCVTVRGERLREFTRAATSTVGPVMLVDCNQFYVTTESVFQAGRRTSYPLAAIEISFDHAENRLEIRVTGD